MSDEGSWKYNGYKYLATAVAFSVYELKSTIYPRFKG